jgi:hypothetical protein
MGMEPKDEAIREINKARELTLAWFMVLTRHCGHRTNKYNGHAIPYGVCCHDDCPDGEDSDFACSLYKCPLL